jgi:hypothetical protein
MIPRNKIILAACIGTGIQFTVVIVLEIIFGFLGIYYGHKGTIKTTGIMTYAFTGCNSIIVFMFSS